MFTVYGRLNPWNLYRIIGLRLQLPQSPDTGGHYYQPAGTGYVSKEYLELCVAAVASALCCLSVVYLFVYVHCLSHDYDSRLNPPPGALVAQCHLV